MAKQLNIALDFSANTTQAKQSIQELQQLLTKVAYGTDLKIDATPMKEASEAAKQLAIHLNEAYNTKTGNYDLSKLDASLAKSKTSVTELANSLLKAGDTGQQAFIKLAQSIAQADQPMITLNARLQDFLTTVKNTVKWQISSSMIHNVMGALQGAYGYAQDLNKSLNDIRIVTGHNIDYMDKFADKANKAAKALSTSTLNYTDASLIYYQQGLTDQEVEDRTAVTIKMANAAGESAEKVSQQLTAVWNNFYKEGGKSLEYYADVMTALGAATASSTDEIAEGLEKFAAVSNTVGLSYEYATSALATVTATTRQSADIVGTAFKTLFARIQDLELGKTLDDGTTLGKYSQALDAVGVSIKNADGGLRDMDDILDDLGEKWNSFDIDGNPLISKDAKVALAQTVAGVRQYTQLMALMDNWDFMKENLGTARNATGTLTEQQKIYEESWEAANKRLKASFQSLYQDLIDDKFFIKFTDFLSDMVDGVDNFIDSIGGLKPLLIGLLSLVGQTLASKIQPALDSAVHNIKILTGGTDKAYKSINDQTEKSIKTELETNKYSPEQKQILINTKELLGLRQKLNVVSDNLSATEKQYWNSELESIQQLQNETVTLIKQREKLKKESNPIDLDAPNKIYDYGTNYTQELKSESIELQNQLNKQKLSKKERKSLQADYITNQNDLEFLKNENLNVQDQAAAQLTQTIERLTNAYYVFVDSEEEANNVLLSGQDLYSLTIEGLEKLGQKYQELNGNVSLKTVQTSIDLLIGPIDEATKQSTAFEEAYVGIKDAIDGGNLNEISTAFNKLAEILKKTSINGKDAADVLEKMGRSVSAPMKQAKNDVQAQGKALKQYRQIAEEARRSQEKLNNAIENFNPKHNIPFTETVMSWASAFGSAAMAISSLTSIIDTLSDPDTSAWEKFSSLLMGISMLVPSITSAYKGFKTGIEGINAAIIRGSEAYALRTGAAYVDTLGIDQNTAKLIANTLASSKLTDENKKNLIALILRSTGMDADTAALQANNIITGEGIILTKSFSYALKELWFQFVKILPTILPYIAALAAIAAAIAGIIYLIKQSKKNSLEGQLKTAKEEASALTDNLKKVQETAEKVKETFDNYDSISDKLKECKQGTTEWNEALLEANANILDLIKLMPELATMTKDGESAIYRDESTGQLKIHDWAREAILNKTYANVSTAQIASIVTNKKVRELEIETSKADLEENFGTTALNKNITITSKHGDVSQRKYFDTLSSQLNDFYKLTEEEQKTFLKNFNTENGFTISDDNITKISQILNNGDFKNSINKYQAALEENTAAIKLENQTITETILGNNELYRNLNSGPDKDAAQAIFNTIANNRERVEKLVKDEGGYSDSDIKKNKDQNLLNKYGSNAGYNNISGAKWGSDSVTFTYADSDGNLQDGEIKYSSLASYKLAEEVQGRLANSVDQLAYNFLTLANSGTQASEALMGLATGDFNTLDESVVQSIGGYKNGKYELDEDKLENQLKAMGFTIEEYATSVGYSSSEAFIEALNEAFTEYDPVLAETNRLRKEQNEIDSILSKGAADADTTSGALKAYAEYLGETYDSLKDNKKAAAEAAVACAKFARGVSKLKEVLGNNLDVLKDWVDTGEATIETFEEVAKVQEALTDVFGVEVSADYIKKNLTDIEKLANGDTSALKELRKAAADDYILHLSVDDSVQQELQAAIDKVYELGGLDPSIDIQANLNDADCIDGLNKLLATGKLTSEEVEKAFNAIGYQPDIKWTTKKGPETETKTHGTVTWTDPAGQGVTYTTTGTTYTQSDIAVPYIAGNDTASEKGIDLGNGKSTGATVNGTGFTARPGTNTMLANGLTSDVTNGSGGSKKDAKKLDDEIDRYHELTEAIEDVDRALNRLGKERQKSYGRNYLNYLDAEIKKTEELIDLNEQKIKQAQTNLLVDRGALMAKASAAGTSVSFDELGRITNYDSMIAQAVGAYNGALTDEAEQAYSDFKNAISQYEETLNLLEDLGEQIQDYKDEILSKNYEKLTYELEVNITLNDNDLKILDYYINKCSDDFYKMGEAIAYTAKQSDSYIGKLEAQNNFLKKIEEDYKNGKISQADYVSGMQDSLDVIIENLEALNELDKTMKEYYGNTLEAAAQELSKYTDHLDALSEATEHLKKISELMGHDTAKELKSFYNAQVKQSENSLKVSTAHYNELVKRNQAIKDKWEEVKNDPNNKNYDYYKKQFEDVVKAEDEAYNKMLSDAENLAQILKDRLSNALQAAADKMEKSMSGIYGNFDRLNDAIGHMKTLSDEYLTSTNKIYETNKLLRKIEQDTMKTTNASAKAKYSAFAKEIEQLQQKDKLSAFELSIAQAKYKLLQAQIALEEAQNAKNTIRLSRDAEGNFGYAYTANADDISEAEQAVEDADNDLYNIRLNGANDYAQKVIQAQQDLQSKLAEIDEKYANDETARNEARAQAIDEYYELIKTYQDLYGIATDEDLRIREDAWSTHFEDLILDTENWKNAVNDYTQDSKNAFNDFDQGLQQVKGSVGNSLGDMISKTRELTNESSNLAKETEEKVIPIIGDKLSEALNKTSEYVENQRSTIQELISTYESLISSIRDAIRAQAELNDALASTPSTNVDGYVPSSGGGTGGDDGKDSNSGNKGTTLPKEKSMHYWGTSPETRVIPKYTQGYKTMDYNGTTYFTWGDHHIWYKYSQRGNGSYVAKGTPGYQYYNTGGYTGNWGPEGKLAVLHEKEIVLNKEDTQNLLMTVDMVRQIANSIEEHALNWSLGTITSPTTDNSNNVLEQTVTITASFPNATQHSEIEEAFTTLINRASQYANRT